MTRVLLVRCTSDGFGGIERQILHIAKGIVEECGLEAVLVTSSTNTRFAKAYAALGLPVETAPHLNTSVFRGAAEVDRIVARHGIRIVQSHMFKESIVARMVRIRRRGLLHLARVHTYIDCSWIPEWRKLSYHVLERMTAHGVDRFVPITHLAARELVTRSFVPQRKIVVIPDGVPQLGVPDAMNASCAPLPPKIAMVANFVEHKGHDVLVRGLAELKRRGLCVHARLVGGEHATERNTPFTDRIMKMAQREGVLGQCEFHGSADDVYTAISDYPVIVLPSDSEGLPNCILEAMSVRKLVVASRAGGIPEIITDGQNGLLHRVQDHIGLADILARVFTSPAHVWEDMRVHAMETWRLRYSVDALLRNLKQVYVALGIGR
jgi:glycosyltransferase involved in cell wall biosynthesis